MNLLKIIVLCFGLVSCTLINKNKKEETAELHLQMGVSYIQQQNYPLALRELLTAQSLDPRNPVIQNNIGLNYFLMKKYKRSIKHFQKAIRFSSKYTEARSNLARVYIEVKKYKEAQNQLMIAKNDLTYPNPEKIWINLGLIDFKNKKYSEAIKSFLKAIEVGKRDCLSHYMYGRSLYSLKKYTLAGSALDKSIKVCQDSLPEPYYYSALSYYRSGYSKKSQRRFKQVLEKFPESSLAESARKFISIKN